MKLLFKLEFPVIVLISWQSWTIGQEKQEQQSIDCDEPTPKTTCVNFEDYGFTDQSPSIFVLEARGRLGNHLMAFVSIMALQKVLKIQPFVTEDTAKYLEQYFVVDDIPVIHREFCNLEQMHFDLFYDSIDDLVEAKHLHKGHVINLWPQGYMDDAKECCPADDLMKFVNEHWFAEMKETLKMKPKFLEHAEKIKANISEQYSTPLDDVTFVGIHHRMTDYTEYMMTKFYIKPLKKSYFKDAMSYYREEKETEKVAFLYVSDDMDWGRKNIKNKKHKDVFFVGIGTEDPDAIGYDLAVMVASDYTIITRGSFSSFCAILNGGEYYGPYGPVVPPQVQNEKPRKRKKKKKIV